MLCLLTWTDSNGKGHGVSGNDRAAYASAAAKIQQQIDQGITPDREGRKILENAKYIGVFNPR